MRALKTILVMLFTVVGLAAILALLGPATTVIARTKVVQVPFAQAQALQLDSAQWRHWLPSFRAQAPLQATAAGDSLVATGTFPDPFTGAARAVMTLQAMGDSTAATWTFTAENDIYARIFLMLNEAARPVEEGLDRSLGQLGALADAAAASQAVALRARTFHGFPVQEETRPSITWAGLKETVKWADLDAFLAHAFQVSGRALHSAGMDSSGTPAAVYYKWDTLARKAEVFAGLPVPSDTVRLPGVVMASVTAGPALVIEYHGHHDRSAQAYAALEEMMQERGMRPRGSPHEEYVVAPWQEADSAKWLMRIVQPVE